MQLRRHGHDGHLEADHHARPGWQLAEAARHHFGRLANHFLPALAAERPAHARVEQPHVIVDLGRRADGRSRVAYAVLLPDSNGGADTFDAIDVRVFHPLEELPGVGRERLDVATLPLRVDRVEGERRLPRPADASDDDQAARR